MPTRDLYYFSLKAKENNKEAQSLKVNSMTEIINIACHLSRCRHLYHQCVVKICCLCQ